MHVPCFCVYMWNACVMYVHVCVFLYVCMCVCVSACRRSSRQGHFSRHTYTHTAQTKTKKPEKTNWSYLKRMSAYVRMCVCVRVRMCYAWSRSSRQVQFQHSSIHMNAQTRENKIRGLMKRMYLQNIWKIRPTTVPCQNTIHVYMHVRTYILCKHAYTNTPFSPQVNISNWYFLKRRKLSKSAVSCSL